MNRIFRSLWRDRGLVGAAVLCLALGVATQAVVVELAHELLLRGPAGVEDSDDLRRLSLTTRSDGDEGHSSLSYPVFRRLQDLNLFADSTAFLVTETPYRLGDQPHKSRAVVVGEEYFRLLGVSPARGRLFTAGETRPSDLPTVAVLSHGQADRLFGSAEAALGEKLQVAGRPFEIIGVLPPEFVGTELHRADLFLPLGALQVLGFSPGWERNPDAWTLQVLARLRDEVPAAVAAERGLATAAAYRHDAVALNLSPLQPGRQPGSVLGRLLLGLSLVTAAVLLIAVLNVASLFVARHLRRSRELAIRTTLGATRGDLLRLLSVEAIWVGVPTAGLAVGLAALELHLLRSVLLPSEAAMAGFPVLRLLAVVVGLLAIVVPACALLPALRLHRADPAPILRGGGSSAGRGRRRLESLLLAGQVSLAVLAVVSLGWFLSSLQQIRSLDLGLEPERVLVTTMDTGSIPSTQRTLLFEQARERALGIAGVEEASLGKAIPFGSSYGVRVALPDRQPPTLATGGPYFNAVSSGFFRTLGLEIVRGRSIEPRDLRSGSAPVVVVNETMAQTYWPGERALGACLGIDGERCARVVGVVENAHRSKLREEPSLQLYVPWSQGPEWISGRALFVRVPDDGAEVAAAIRRALQPLATGWVDVEPLAARLKGQMRPFELATTLASVAALLALALIFLGLYAGVSRRVTERRRELGVRLALGAGRGRVLWSVFRSLLAYLVPGILVGIWAAVGLGRWAEPLLFETAPADPVLLLTATLLLVTVAGMATWFPARRASRTSPTVALGGR